jgi:hypothetical protein
MRICSEHGRSSAIDLQARLRTITLLCGGSAAAWTLGRPLGRPTESTPKEALEPRSEDWEDLASRYEYLAEHQAILKKLGIQE